MHELEDSGVELERTRSELAAMDKKCKKVDQIVLEWKGKYDTASSQVEGLTIELQKSNVCSCSIVMSLKSFWLSNILSLNVVEIYGGWQNFVLD